MISNAFYFVDHKSIKSSICTKDRHKRPSTKESILFLIFKFRTHTSRKKELAENRTTRYFPFQTFPSKNHLNPPTLEKSVTYPRFWMTNFAACRTKRSFVTRANAIHETLSRATANRVGTQSVLSGYRTNRVLPTHHPASDGQKIGEWNCGASIASGHSSSTLNSRCTLNSRASTATSYAPNSIISCRQHPAHRCCCALNRADYQSDRTSVISTDYLARPEKCGLCKEPIKFFREEYVCGHSYHGECIWRFEKLNPTYDSNNCPKKCHTRPMIKRTRSIESHSSSRSSASSASSSSRDSSSSRSSSTSGSD